MDTFSDPFEHDYSDDEPIVFSSDFEDTEVTASQVFDDEVEVWALRALAANGFGDY